MNPAIDDAMPGIILEIFLAQGRLDSFSLDE